MKSITMDYDTYKKELETAKVEGASVVRDLEKRLNNLLAAMNGYNRDDLFKAEQEIRNLVYELRQVDVLNQ